MPGTSAHLPALRSPGHRKHTAFVRALLAGDYQMPSPKAPEAKGTKWYHYLVSVDEVETRICYDLLRDLPDEVENAIEARVATPRRTRSCRRDDGLGGLGLVAP
jgi:hypothetical protein